jgi:hypothetical protein
VRGEVRILAKHEGEIRARAEKPLSLSELLELMGTGSEAEERARQHAIACYLSAGEGWREAVKELGGAFAEEEPGLRERKAE